MLTDFSVYIKSRFFQFNFYFHFIFNFPRNICRYNLWRSILSLPCTEHVDKRYEYVTDERYNELGLVTDAISLIRFLLPAISILWWVCPCGILYIFPIGPHCLLSSIEIHPLSVCLWVVWSVNIDFVCWTNFVSNFGNYTNKLFVMLDYRMEKSGVTNFVFVLPFQQSNNGQCRPLGEPVTITGPMLQCHIHRLFGGQAVFHNFRSQSSGNVCHEIRFAGFIFPSKTIFEVILVILRDARQ